MTATSNRIDWKTRAKCFARDSRENHFSSRRGLWWIEDLDVFCLYDNNPFKDFVPGGGSAKRDRIIAQLQSYLRQNGHKVLASATYPEVGDSAGYTFAMLFSGRPEDESAIHGAISALISASDG